MLILKTEKMTNVTAPGLCCVKATRFFILGALRVR